MSPLNTRSLAPLFVAYTTLVLAQQQAPEVATRDVDLAAASFRSKVNLVLVPVVVRDKKGNAIGTLKREDFELFDKGKPQAIAKFSIEKAGSQHVEFEPEPVADPSAPATAKPAESIAERFTVLLFDDLHTLLSDLMNVRLAANNYLSESSAPQERIAVLTTSGKVALDFTADRNQVHEAINKVQNWGRVPEKKHACPPMTYFEAIAIEKCEGGSFCRPLDIAANDVWACLHDPNHYVDAPKIATAAAHEMIGLGGEENRQTFTSLSRIVRGLAAMPGQRTLLFISPGFYEPEHFTDLHQIIDSAIRSRVIVNALDPRGLSTQGTVPDASESVLNQATFVAKQQMERNEVAAAMELIEELAEDTGGTAFVNNNDLVGGFKKLSGTPEFTYILGFSPQNLKFDGSLHALKVKVRNGGSYTIQARRGYFAPKHLEDPAEQARQEIEEAMFSREVMRDLPVELHSQYFKTGEFDAKLTVLARVNLAQLNFKKEAGRNDNELTIVTALFDKDGNLQKGSKKTVTLKVKDETLADKTRSVVTFKSSFDVKIGGYVIRLVVRDREGQSMTAENGSVIIP